MDASAEYHKLTERNLEDIAQADYPSISLMNRVERMISSKDELETYAAILGEKALEGGETAIGCPLLML